MSSAACCVLRVACCMMSVACHMLHAATWRARSSSQQLCTHARARADALVDMAAADEAVERTDSVAHARTVHWPQLQRHMLCTAAAPHPSLHSSFGLQLSQIALNCNAAEKALLADVTEAHPDATYVELLRLFKVRRSVAD